MFKLHEKPLPLTLTPKRNDVNQQLKKKLSYESVFCAKNATRILNERRTRRTRRTIEVDTNVKTKFSPQVIWYKLPHVHHAR